MRLIQPLTSCYTSASGIAADWLGPTVLLLMRVWVALAFWHAGVVKFEDPYGTQFLFNTMYQVPLLPPDAAAFLGTWIELIAPWLLGFGIAGRFTALFLFVYNIIAVVSYPALWPHGFWTGLFSIADFADHKTWALMLLAVVAWGPGRWSVDALVGRVRRAWPTHAGSTP
ncbi:MAG: DoxX family protein [Xanthomonadaceae bacterium]|nr:DoxX family protein [Xanthomonadaceae bacterium]MDE1964870.1 DoxX family protein [Xanthomonadaceae bacterium]